MRATSVPAGTARAVRNETDDGAAFAMISVRVDDQMAESVPHEGFWR